VSLEDARPIESLRLAIRIKLYTLITLVNFKACLLIHLHKVLVECRRILWRAFAVNGHRHEKDHHLRHKLRGVANKFRLAVQLPVHLHKKLDHFKELDDDGGIFSVEHVVDSLVIFSHHAHLDYVHGRTHQSGNFFT